MTTVLATPPTAASETVPARRAPASPLSAWWLAVGLVSSSATAWRLPGTPVGTGEIVLALWLLFEWVRHWRAGVPMWRRAELVASRDVLALVATLGTLAVAQLYANASGRLGWGAQRDFLAVLFAGALAYTVVNRRDRAEFSRALLIAFFWTVTVFASLLLIYGLIPRPDGLAPIVFNPVFGTRFMGLAANPNQFALLMLTLPVGVAVAWAHYSGRSRRVSLAAGCFGLMAGLATQSDALMLTWVLVSATAVAAVALERWKATPGPGVPALVLAGAVAVAFVAWPMAQRLTTVRIPTAAPPVEGAAAAPTGPPAVKTTTYAKIVDEERRTNPQQVNQVDTRLRLYTNGLRAWLDRPIMGHGVQMVSGLTGPYEKNEAHNTLIDWLTFSGVIGLIPLVVWSLLLTAYAWRRRNFLGIAGILALAIFAQFGLYVRHPLFWVVACAFASLPAVGSLERGVE